MVNLGDLQLGLNQLIGSIPTKFGNLTKPTTLYPVAEAEINLRCGESINEKMQESTITLCQHVQSNFVELKLSIALKMLH